MLGLLDCTWTLAGNVTASAMRASPPGAADGVSVTRATTAIHRVMNRSLVSVT